MIGNPWLSPSHQYPAFLSFAKQLSLLTGHWLELAEAQMDACLKELKLENGEPPKTTISHCERVMETILDSSKEGGQLCINKYSV